jgi:hypothetical protein
MYKVNVYKLTTKGEAKVNSVNDILVAFWQHRSDIFLMSNSTFYEQIFKCHAILTRIKYFNVTFKKLNCQNFEVSQSPLKIEYG